MTEVLEISKIDEAFIKISCDPSVAYELNDYFTFEVPGAKFMPMFRNKVWDGKIRLFNVMSGTIYAGLLEKVKIFGQERGYNMEYKSDFTKTPVSDKSIKSFLSSLDLTIEPRDYQIDALRHAVNNERGILLSPTASGKSLIIYMLTRFYNAKTLIIVPTTSLVDQLISDFADYGFDSASHCHGIYSGRVKDTNKQVTISTWQSIYKLPKPFFGEFDVVIGDEAHLFKARSLTSIMTKLNKCRYRFGFTGTLDNTQTNKLVLEGLFGPVYKVTTTAKLIEDKHLADFKIRCLVLQYTEAEKKLAKEMEYKDEIKFLTLNSKRNKFIKDLAINLKGNTLILFQFVENHGKALHQLISEKAGDRKVFFVYGGVEAADREAIRKIVEKENDAIIVASYGTFSTGINIKKLHNVVFASPTKSRIRALQSIGRGLRKSDEKDEAVLYDIADDLSYKSYQNYTLRHFLERIKIYDEERFTYKIYRYVL